MASRSLAGINYGWVNIEELGDLLAFRGTSERTIANFLSDSRMKLPQLMSGFLGSCMRFRPKGPYRLLLPPEAIHTDLRLLEEYLTLVYQPSKPIESSLEETFEAAKLDMSKFEYGAADRALRRGITYISSSKDNHLIYIPLIFINLASISYMTCNSRRIITSSLSQAEKYASNIKDRKVRDLLQAHVLERRIWTTPMNESNSQSLFELNRRVIEVVSSLPRSMPDRAALLGGRYYFQLYNELRFGKCTEFNKTISLLSQRLLFTSAIFRQ